MSAAALERQYTVFSAYPFIRDEDLSVFLHLPCSGLHVSHHKFECSVALHIHFRLSVYSFTVFAEGNYSVGYNCSYQVLTFQQTCLVQFVAVIIRHLYYVKEIVLVGRS